jgi:hypothetical protein
MMIGLTSRASVVILSGHFFSNWSKEICLISKFLSLTSLPAHCSLLYLQNITAHVERLRQYSRIFLTSISTFQKRSACVYTGTPCSVNNCAIMCENFAPGFCDEETGVCFVDGGGGPLRVAQPTTELTAGAIRKKTPTINNNWSPNIHFCINVTYDERLENSLLIRLIVNILHPSTVELHWRLQEKLYLQPFKFSA